MDYRQPAVEAAVATKPVFARRAAQWAFWMPIVVFALGWGVSAAAGRTEQAGVRTLLNYTIPVLALAALAALVLGVVGLAGVRQHGSRGILWPSAGGIVMSLVLLSLFVLMLVMNPAATVTKRLAGEWEGQRQFGPTAVGVQLSLNLDGFAAVTMQGPSGMLRGQGEWRAPWQAEARKALLLIRFDGKQDPGMGEGMVWSVERLGEEELVLQTKRPDGTLASETYRRKEKPRIVR